MIIYDSQNTVERNDLKAAVFYLKQHAKMQHDAIPLLLPLLYAGMDNTRRTIDSACSEGMKLCIFLLAMQLIGRIIIEISSVYLYQTIFSSFDVYICCYEYVRTCMD